jgi:hypothetical protein
MLKKRDHSFSLYESLAADRVKLNKLNGHVETVHAECVGRTPKFFHRKIIEFNMQKQTFTKITTITLRPLLASFKVAYRIAVCKNPHTDGESLVLPATVDS